MKILIFPQIYPLRPEVSQIFAKHFRDYNHKITMMVDKKNEERFISKKNLEIHVSKFVNFIAKIVHFLFYREFDVVITRDHFYLLLIGYIFKKIQGIPLIFNINNPKQFLTQILYAWYHPKRIGGFLENLLIIKLLKKADLILPVSKWMGYYLINKGIKKNKIQVFPSGSDTENFKSNISYPKNCLVPKFIYVGTMVKIRKMQIILYALEKVKKRYNNVKLYMIGNGNDLKNLLKLSKNLDIRDNVEFTGYINFNEIPNYIQKAHACLSPIPPENLYKLSSPIKIFEYISCARPIIANEEIPAHKKLIEESKCGLLTKYTPESFAEAMIKIIEDKDTAEEMGLKGREWVEKNRSYKILASNVEEKILEIIQTP